MAVSLNGGFFRIYSFDESSVPDRIIPGERAILKCPGPRLVGSSAGQGGPPSGLSLQRRRGQTVRLGLGNRGLGNFDRASSKPQTPYPNHSRVPPRARSAGEGRAAAGV